jgi:hypothetical protein
MAKNKKPLLNEGTVRRMMKLANMEALGNGFISEKYSSLEEDEAYTAKKEKPGADKRKGAEKRGAEGTLAKTKGHGRVDYVDEDLNEDEDYTAKKEKPGADKRKGAEKRGAEGTLAKTKGHGRVDYVNEELNEDEDELESELHATEDELGDMDSEADRERDELEADDAEMEGEVTITDEEAQDIIDLADKLKDAVGDEPDAEMPMDLDIDAEEEIDIEEPGSRMYEEELYEAALKGLNIDVVDDKAEQRKALVQEAKKRIYERVVRRLIAESKK